MFVVNRVYLASGDVMTDTVLRMEECYDRHGIFINSIGAIVFFWLCCCCMFESCALKLISCDERS